MSGYSGAEQVREAREALAEALAALQEDPSVPSEAMAIAQHIARAMASLFEAERASSEPDGRACAKSALGFASQTLTLLQEVDDEHPSVQATTEALARTMRLLFPLAKAGSTRPPPRAPLDAHEAAPIPLVPKAARVPRELVAEADGSMTETAPVQDGAEATQPPEAQPTPQEAARETAALDTASEVGASHVGATHVDASSTQDEAARSTGALDRASEVGASHVGASPTQDEAARETGALDAASEVGASHVDASPTPHEAPREDASPGEIAVAAPASTEAAEAAEESLAREAVEVNLGASTESNFYVGFSGEIDRGGVFVCTYDLLPVGTPVRLLVTLPGNYSTHVDGHVRFLRDPLDMADEAEPGMGVAFDALDEGSRGLIMRFIRNRPPLFYDD